MDFGNEGLKYAGDYENSLPKQINTMCQTRTAPKIPYLPQMTHTGTVSQTQNSGLQTRTAQKYHPFLK